MKLEKTVVILQPSYIPWLGFFDQIYQSDEFVFFDDVQYTRRDWRSRNRVKNSKGEAMYVTIPVKNKGNYYAKINEVEILEEQDWREQHLKTIQNNYVKAKYFQDYFPLLKSILNNRSSSLAEYTMKTTKELSPLLGIKDKRFSVSSDLRVTYSDPTDHLVKICKKLGATKYLSGSSARAYIREDEFRENNIILEYQDYQHPVYQQLWGTFLPYLSIIDLLLNEGPRSLDILSSIK